MSKNGNILDDAQIYRIDGFAVPEAGRVNFLTRVRATHETLGEHRASRGTPLSVRPSRLG